MRRPTRRDFLAVGAGALAWPRFAAGGGEVADAGGEGLIVRSAMPLDAETPVGAFDRFLTPNDRFFVRSHFGAPSTVLRPWTLRVDGMVDRPLDLSLADLEGMERATLPAVLQCSGNGRAFFRPTIPGVGWERGAVGNAEWSGVRLADVLERAGAKAGALHVQMHGADLPPNPKTPAYFRSLPIGRALDRSTLLATAMNGEPLPWLHGGPIRVVVPGWSGNHWIKWLRGLTVASEEAPGFYQRTGYKIPLVPGPPGVDPKPGDLVPVTALNVKSLIARPLDGATLAAGRVEARGVAWTGDGVVDRVEVALGDGPDARWEPARLEGGAIPGTWRTWSFAWDAAPGRHALRARATDSNGQAQPEATPWNKSGYLWNAIDRVAFEVR